MYEQSLPGYTTAFKKVSWVVHESAHYRFHYFKDSLAEKEIEYIEQTQEKAYAKITKFLDLPSYPDAKIGYYLYPDAQTKGRLMGSSWFAQSIYNDFAVHALYTEEHRVIGPHEDTHLLSLPLGLSIGFLQEGLAEYLVGHDWYGNPFVETLREVRDDKGFKVAADLPTTHQTWADTGDNYARQYYALAALFTACLIEKCGREKYLQLYQSLKRGATQEENEARYIEIFDNNSRELFAVCLDGILR